MKDEADGGRSGVWHFQFDTEGDVFEQYRDHEWGADPDKDANMGNRLISEVIFLYAVLDSLPINLEEAMDSVAGREFWEHIARHVARAAGAVVAAPVFPDKAKGH